jgi:hypothetical protein
MILIDGYGHRLTFAKGIMSIIIRGYIYDEKYSNPHI